MHRFALLAVLIFILAVLRTPVCLAQDQTNEDAAELVASGTDAISPGLPLWEAGVFAAGLTQPAYPGAEERASLVLGLPFFIYRGEYLRVDRSTVGVRAIKTGRTELDVGFSASLGSRSADIEARRGMDDLGFLLEFGPRLKINLGDHFEGSSESKIQLPVRGVFDANDHLNYRGIAFEPQWVNDVQITQGWLVSSNFGAVFGNRQLAETFYRVTPSEATPTRPAYEAVGGLIALRASFFLSRLLTPELRFFSYLRFDSLEGAANHSSPLVRRDSGWSLGLGLAWTLARSERSARD